MKDLKLSPEYTLRCLDPKEEDKPPLVVLNKENEVVGYISLSNTFILPKEVREASDLDDRMEMKRVSLSDDISDKDIFEIIKGIQKERTREFIAHSLELHKQYKLEKLQKARNRESKRNDRER